MTKKTLHTGRIINMLRTTLPFILAGTLATFPALAEDGFDFMGGNVAQVEKVAKAPREANPHCTVGPMCAGPLKSMGTGAVLGLLGPVGLIGVPFAAAKITADENQKLNSFYLGTVLRGKVNKVEEMSKNEWGISPGLVSVSLVALILDVDGPVGSDRVVLADKHLGFEKGDIVDVKMVSAEPDKSEFNFNRHKPRVVALYCKHDQPCQNDYDSSLGVLYRHQDKEFPVSQYLIDPAIIAADQAKMRKEAEETKTASNSGSFSFF
ncbi:MAG: hypothetical protein PHD37_06555 [Gallionellaceae bacterium]|nr:hypothetical protein [Gallionellaceae bacterium]